MENENEKLVEVNYQPYKKKHYFFSVPELKFFELLKEIIGDNYHIFPKVRICDIIELKNRKSYSDFNRIKSKHVDFLLCTKHPITAKILIELDDSSHDKPDRQERDAFVDEIFANSGIPIVHIKTQYEYNKDDITKQLQEAYKTKYVIKEDEEEDEEEKQNKFGCGSVLMLLLIAIATIVI